MKKIPSDTTANTAARPHRLAVTVAVLLALVLQGCHVSFSSGGQRYEGAGVVFVTPSQTSEVNTSPAGIEYKSKNLNASTDGHSLLVNGKAYGALKSGDVVDFTDEGTVKVNGIPRAPAGI